MADWDEVCKGKYQILTAFLLCCVQLPITFSDHLLPIYSWIPHHRCRLPPQNGTMVGHGLSWPIVERDGKKMFSSCEMYVDPGDHSFGTQACKYGWDYLHEEEEWNLVIEWNLVCEREYLINLLPYAYTVGAMAGGLVFGLSADSYGRRCNLLAALIMHTVLGLALHFVHMFTLFAVGYAFQGLLVTAIQCTSFILLLESVLYSSHLKATVALCFVSPLGIMLLAVVSWLIKNWRYIQLAVSAPGIVCLGYFWLIPRSLQWLMAEGYADGASDQILQFAQFNNVILPNNYRLKVLNFCKKIKSFSTESKHSLETVVCSEKIRRYTFILYYMWFVLALDSTSSKMEFPALRDNKYALLFVKGLIDTGLLILIYFFAHSCGPRSAHASLLIFGGLLCMGSACLNYSRYFETVSIAHLLHFIYPILSVIGQACIKSTVVTNIFFSLKIFPTGVRAFGFGTCLFWTRAAELVGIHISSMETPETYFYPLAIHGFLCVIGGILTSCLPSNFNRPLPIVVEEIEKNIILDCPRRKRSSSRTLSSSLDQIEPSDIFAELSVQNLESLSLERPGPSGLFRHDSKEDIQSRLTDFEDELRGIWDRSPLRTEEDSLTGSLRDYTFDNVREHYLKMNETRF